MKQYFLAILSIVIICTTACTDYNQVLKTQDYEYKYEAAKACYAEGYYNRAATLLQDVLSVLKGTDQGEESLYLAGLSNMKAHNYELQNPNSTKQTRSTLLQSFRILLSFSLKANCALQLKI